MQNNLFYSRGNKNIPPHKSNFKEKKEKTIASLNEVENFLFNFKHFMKYVKLYKLFK